MRPKADNTAEALMRCPTVADVERDFALKFYAEEGNWDLVGSDGQGSRSFQPQQPAENAANTGVKDERND